MKTTSAWKGAACSGLIALMVIGCTSDDDEPRDPAPPYDVDASTSVDAGGDAGAIDAARDSSALDARTDALAPDAGDGSLERPGDAQADGRAEMCAEAYETVSSFVRAHRQCSVDDDCAIIGSCSGSLGFYAVRADARDAGQPLTEHTLCGTSDGPTFTAVCENQLCVRRYDGAACGGVASKCQRTHELYEFSCPGDAPLQTGSCHQRCSGASDTSCAPDFSCQQREVVTGWTVGGGGCSAPRVATWLCMPKPTCDVVLSIDAAGAKSRSLFAAGSTRLALELWAENRTEQPKTFTYQRPCPGGPQLSGLGSYDPWETCAAGACPTNPPQQVTIPAGERVSLGMAHVQTSASTCNAGGLAVGEYTVGFSLAEVSGATVCAPEPFELRVR